MFAIRETTNPDLPDILAVTRAAFGGEIEADLTCALLFDPTAEPLLSLLALEEGRAVGHILFTRALVPKAKATILAPLSVHPDKQGQGVGKSLIDAGLRNLKSKDVGLVFVLGDPGYYARHGFEPAQRHGLDAPYPIAGEHADAWMVQALRPGLLVACRGTVLCADALNKPELWRD
jgi:putative acetyltransferase